VAFRTGRRPTLSRNGGCEEFRTSALEVVDGRGFAAFFRHRPYCFGDLGSAGEAAAALVWSRINCFTESI